ncbi:IS110 family transposase [Lewinella sp. 4G2]|uniref:IS110 family transposase n=1 Tax=Lewinella sp. 4G2 TaxID=1803372 RepID=UPI0007DF8F45|nr:IS110 family transposase [Lewinella sp. 4G2]OAV46147.1 hypothetical protein A3850_017970 [Lewinella sp. 4G2]
MKYSFIMGIDAAAGKFDYHLMDRQETEICFDEVQLAGLNVQAWFSQLCQTVDCPVDGVLVCIENTGVYSIGVAYELHLAGVAVWLEDAFQIKQSSGRVNSKTDRLDAMRIARYGLRNHTDYQAFVADAKIVINLKSLNQQRGRLLKAKNQLANAIGEERRYVPTDLRPTDDYYADTEDVLNRITQAIKAIEAKVAKLIRQDARCKRMNEVLTSLPGIGPVTALKLMLKTNLFARGFDHRRIASYLGIAPHQRQSGKRLNEKPRTRKNVDKACKASLYMGMLRHVNSDNRIGHYYRRKIAEGKHHNSAINAVSNIILETACACLRKDELYVEKFAKNLQTS